jgi:DNA (cytosine-5)-methyltransferase 1
MKRRPLREGSLFTGYNGLGIAVSEVFGSEPAWFADNATGPSAILAHHWPHVPNLGDVTAVDWSAVAPVDVLTGGFPCQDVSLAGRQTGLQAANRSGLWRYMAAAVAALRPMYVAIENVRSLASAKAHSDVEQCAGCVGNRPGKPALRALGAVLGDMAGMGYDACWCCVPASAVGAPHRRQRIFVLAADTRREAVAIRSGLPPCDADRQRRRRPHDGDAQALPAAAGWGRYAAAIARWEHITGRIAPDVFTSKQHGGRVLSPAFVEWMQGLPAGFVTGVPGITRPAQVRALGNGVVPQQAAAALRLLLSNYSTTEGVR